MDSQTLFGMKACLAMLEHRPQDLIRLYHAKNMRRHLRGMLAWAAARHIPYRELDAEGLQKVASTAHHEGIVAVCRPLRYRELSLESASEATRDIGNESGRGGALWVALDGVANPHNLGAIMRSCAFFGAAGLLAGGAAPGEKVNAAALRVAEGGAEHLALHGAPELAEALGILREGGFALIGLETGGAPTLAQALHRHPPQKALALVLGAEQDGLSRAARRACGTVCHLPGEGAMSSLNVSVAAGVALAEAARKR